MGGGTTEGMGSAPMRWRAAAMDAEVAARLTPQQFVEQYERCWRILWCAAAAAVRDRSLAEDLVQQAAVVGLEHLGDFESGTNFVSWMVRIVKNLAMNEARRGARRRTSSTDPMSLDGSVSDVKGAGRAGPITGLGQVREDQAEFDDTMMGALEKLDETARACLLMRVVLDMTYKNIGLALDVPEGTAASHVHRARVTMRTHLRELSLIHI